MKNLLRMLRAERNSFQYEPAEQRTRTVGTFLKLCLASSILQSALILTIYRFHLTPLSSYLLALIPFAPICAILVGALRKRAQETNPYVRKSYDRAMISAGLMTALIPCFLTLSLFTKRSLASAILDAAFPLLLAILFIGVLLMSNSKTSEGSLGDPLLPIRSKLATPTLRRALRSGALFIAYIAVSSACRTLFDSYTLTGALAYAIALLPVLPLFGLVPIYNKYMAEEQDEFQRHLFHQSILAAFFGTFVIVSVIGRLQEHALIPQRASEFFRFYSVFPIFWWLQLEAPHLLNAVQATRVMAQEKKEKQEKKDQ